MASDWVARQRLARQRLLGDSLGAARTCWSSRCKAAERSRSKSWGRPWHIRASLRQAQEVVDGTTYWFAPVEEAGGAGEGPVFLLPTYDEFFMGFAGASRSGGADPQALVFDSMIVVEGQIAGTWRRRFEKDGVILEVVPLAPFTATDPRLLAVAGRFAGFLHMPVEVRLVNAAELKTTGWLYSRLQKLDGEGSQGS